MRKMPLNCGSFAKKRRVGRKVFSFEGMSKELVVSRFRELDVSFVDRLCQKVEGDDERKLRREPDWRLLG